MICGFDAAVDWCFKQYVSMFIFFTLPSGPSGVLLKQFQPITVENLYIITKQTVVFNTLGKLSETYRLILASRRQFTKS